MIQVSRLFIYPVKSLGGIEVQQVQLSDRGFAHDRRWMLVDEQHRFLSQRTLPAMALLQTALTDEGIFVFSKKDTAKRILMPFEKNDGSLLDVTIWDDTCKAAGAGARYNDWFSGMLGLNCKLVYMPGSSKRMVDERYAAQNEITSFSDGYPVLMVGEESLHDLNGRMDAPVPLSRFRPNLVITGAAPYKEDVMQQFSINGLHFRGVKPCSRCIMTTIDQDSAEKGKEPLKTLSRYRTKNNKIYFGQNVLHPAAGTITTGQEVTILEEGAWPVFE